MKKKVLSMTLVAAILTGMLSAGMFSVSAVENVIDAVELEIHAPLAGQSLGTTSPKLSTYGFDYYLAESYWCDADGAPLGEDGGNPGALTVTAGNTYYVHFSLIASEDGVWKQDIENTTVTIRNGTAVGTLSMDASEDTLAWYGQPAAVGVLAVEAIAMPEGLITELALDFNAPDVGDEVTVSNGKLTPAPDVTLPVGANYSFFGSTFSENGAPVWVDSDDCYDFHVLSEPFTFEDGGRYHVFVKLKPNDAYWFDYDYTDLVIQTDGNLYSTSSAFSEDDGIMVIITFDADAASSGNENTVIDSLFVAADSPVDGTTSTAFAPQVTLDALHCEVTDARWLSTPDAYPAEEPVIAFEAGEYYTMLVTIRADEGYSFEKSGNVATGIDEGLDVFYSVYSAGNTYVIFAGSYTVNGTDYLRLKLDVHAVRPPGPMSYIHVLSTEGGHTEFWSNEYDGDWTQPYDVPEGAEVKLSAVADSGYVFTGWYEGDVNASSYDEMFTDVLITTENPYVFDAYGYPYICAKFEYTGVERQGDQIQVWVTDGGKAAVEYTPSYDDDAYIKPKDGSNYVAVGEVVALWQGDEITVHQRADQGYRFKGWYHVRIEWGPDDTLPKYEGEVISTAPTFTYRPSITVVPGDTEPLRYVCAVFEPDPGAGRRIGDANGDGSINVKDVTAIQRHVAEIEMLSGTALTAADSNGDGMISIDDATALQMYLAEMEVDCSIGETV